MSIEPEFAWYPTLAEYQAVIEQATGEPDAVIRRFVKDFFAEMRRQRVNAKFTPTVGNTMEAAARAFAEIYSENVALETSEAISFDRIAHVIESRTLPIEAIVFANLEIAEYVIEVSNSTKDSIGDGVFAINPNEMAIAVCRQFLDYIEMFEKLKLGRYFVIVKRELLILDRCYNFMDGLVWKG